MFKKSKSKVLVDYASEEDDMSWHHQHTYKVKGPGGEEEEEEEEGEVVCPVSKEIKVKKPKAKKESRKDKKMFSSKDDEHFLISGVKLADGKRAHKKNKEEDREKNKPITERSHCFWDSVTMTMRQITPTKKLDKMEGWEPPQLGDAAETPADDDEPAAEARGGGTGDGDSPAALPPALGLPLGLPPWTGLGPEEDSSRYANLSDPRDSTAVRWTARAKGKLAGIRRRSRGSVSESSWEGFK